MSKYKLAQVWKTDLTTGAVSLVELSVTSVSGVATLHSYFAAITKLNTPIYKDKVYYEPTHEALKLLKFMEIKTFDIARRNHHESK